MALSYVRRLNIFIIIAKQQRFLSTKPNNNMFETIQIPVETEKLLKLTKSLVIPKLSDNKHKGQYGRIGVIGGSLEYTGAPYFAAISALKVGADLAHVFCQRDAVVIKSFSPELIVHPILDANDAVEQIEPWLQRLHVIIIGPGLGREPKVLETAARLIKLCLEKKKPLIIDADGLFLLNNNIELIQGQRNIILTPNAIEFKRLFGDKVQELMSSLGDGIVVLEKGATDKIHNVNTEEVYLLPPGGSGRRCGGQGDLLCGALAIFFHWALESNQSNPAFLAAFAASYLIKQSNAAAFKRLGRSMLASDMLNEIAGVFRENFENSDS